MDTQGIKDASSSGVESPSMSESHNSQSHRSPMERYWSGGTYLLVDLPLLMATSALVAGVLTVLIIFAVLLIVRKCRQMTLARAERALAEETSPAKDRKEQPGGRKMASILRALQAKKILSQIDEEKKKGKGKQEFGGDEQLEKMDFPPAYGMPTLDEAAEEEPVAPVVISAGLVALNQDEYEQESQAMGFQSDERDESGTDVPQYGRLWFSIVYSEVTQKLFIRVIKAKYLKPRDRSNALGDPFVKVYLLPDEFNRQESKIVENTLAPHFDQTFEFTNIRAAVVKQKTIRISVYDIDKRRVRHSHGHVILPLAGYDVASGVVIWRDLEPDQNLPSAVHCGELSVSLKHEQQTQTLLVKLEEGRNMNNSEYYGRNHSVHIQMKIGEKVIQTMTTRSRPFFSSMLYDNDSFVFSIPLDQLKACSLCLIVYIEPTDELRYSDKESCIAMEDIEAGMEIGRVVLGSSEIFAHETGAEHWMGVISQPSQTLTRWHNILSSIQLQTSSTISY